MTDAVPPAARHRSSRAAMAARLAPLLLAAAVAASAEMLPRLLPIAGTAEEALADLRLAALGERAPTQHQGVVLVTITEETLAELPYRSPVDRGLLAEAVAALRAAGPKAVGFDILFDRATEAGKDARLAAALAASPVPIVLAAAGAAEGLDEGQRAYLAAFVAAAKARSGVPALRRDPDGTIRRWPEGAEGNGFVAALARIANADMPASGRIDYLGPPLDGTDTFATLPIESLAVLAAVQPQILELALKDKIVLVGADLPGVDRHRTPLAALGGAAPDMAGVAVHAQMLAQALDGRRVREGGIPAQFAFVFALALAGAALAHWDRAGWQKLLVFAGLVGAVWIAGFALLSEARILIPLATPKIALFGAYGLESARAHRKERKLRRFIRGAFALFVPPAVVEELTKNPARLVLGGERREITVLFTDVEGFTTLAERLPAHELVPLLNAYLDGASGRVLEHGGTIDKFVGDAVVCFFGAPLPQPDHAPRALACARALDAFAEDFRARHPGFGRTRIGVHTGTAVVGNFGGEGRFDYTAMGDTVNTAARLEGANKHLGTRVCVSAVTAEAAGGDKLRRVGQVVLKGRTQPLGVFEPVAAEDAAYGAAYALLEARGSGAASAFGALAAERPGDGLVRMHLARIARGEDGVRIVLEEK